MNTIIIVTKNKSPIAENGLKYHWFSIKPLANTNKADEQKLIMFPLIIISG
ncbi:hypothetical protein [Marinilactibacillus sp. Marseille-P9653]|uniref:hypothetical protein n=1 Tax=Marinilactibacillus sp. Marseille-P9653 TaxID=2866583 RepID=UPI001CE43C93|nr:hypothetical protein [Marinilactibacillus sp. Marseille-P9653]